MKILRNILTVLIILCVLYVFIGACTASFQFSFSKNGCTYSVDPLPRGPIEAMPLLLSLIVYGILIRELFRPIAEWKLVRMLQLGFQFCLLCLAFLAMEFVTIYWLVQLDMHPFYTLCTRGLFYSKLFTAQVALCAILLWWRVSRKKKEAR